MNSNHQASAHQKQRNPAKSPEIVAVAILTLAGAVIRAWSLGRLGLVHFDEGIYALAGLWSISPRGLQSLDPTAIAYSPPGFPILVGLSYLWFGISDTSAILVSIVCGTATIPVIAWLSLRTFGRGAGAAAAALAAFAAVHVSFSRMALTDISFLLAFLLAVGQGQRFLERPNPSRAIFLGLSVGVAQTFKYSGWISGMIVALAVLVGQVVKRKEQSARMVCAAWVWGLLAMSVAAIVYWPWYRFVESHGGYRLLLAHQRGYMSGITPWVDHWSLQLAQARVLSGSPQWRGSVGIAAAVGFSISSIGLGGSSVRWPRLLIQTFGLASLCSVPNVEWWTPLGWISLMAFRSTRFATPAMLLLGIGWLTLSIMTPFYHPYARLWLPLHALGWIVIGGIFVTARSWLEMTDRSPNHERKPRLNPMLGFATICVAALAITATSAMRLRNEAFPGVLEPTDSLRAASRAIPRELPQHLDDLRLFGRPAVAFYLSLESRVSLRSQPDLAHLLEPAGPTTWCLLDTALSRQSAQSLGNVSRLSSHWVAARDFPSYLNLPTLLDIDPGSCYGGPVDLAVPLLLLRPGRREVIR
ncbi:MAG: ArnT family glycosyltransferase [Isosphaeraceae bacterium]